jgi:hypothetical protein
MTRRRTASAWLVLIPVLPAWGQSVIVTDGHAGLPSDWSHRSVVFAEPQSESQRQAIAAEPRYSLQTMRRLLLQFEPEFRLDEAPPDDGGDEFSSGVRRDWNEAIGSSAYTLSSPTYPAKYSFNVASPTPDCTKDYVVYTLPVAATTDFNVIAFNNLYVNSTGSGLCAGTVPTVLFAYNGSQSTGTLSTAPVLSLDGTQIAFIEKSTGAQFHILKWHAGDKSATFPKPFNAAHLANCATNGGVAPCEYSVTYSTATSTLGSPFIDYAGDTAYVTDDKGNVSAIHPVFGATPAKPPAVVTGFPVNVSTAKLTAPSFDSVSKNVFVSDTSKIFYVRTGATSSGACLTGAPPCAGKTNVVISTGSGVGTTQEAPIVDSTNGTVFAFGWSGPPYNGAIIVQSNTTLAVRNVANISGTTGGSTATTIFSGTFDNAYFNNPTTGKLYACGENNGNHFGTLWAAGFASATAIKTGTASFGPLNLTTATIAGAASPCSSLTEVFNQAAGKDFLYTGITSKCAFGGSAAGCIFAFDITSGFPTTAAAKFSSNSGSSGIVIDNVTGSLTSATNLYFLTRQPQGTGSPCTVYTGGTNTTGNCAIKLTQSGLN